VFIFFWRSLTFCPTSHPASNEKSRSGILEFWNFRRSVISNVRSPSIFKNLHTLKDFTPNIAQKIPQVVQVVLLSSLVVSYLLSTSVTTHNQQLILKERNTSPKTHNNPPQPRQRLVRLTPDLFTNSSFPSPCLK
jgi:hypothetical protein